MQLQEVLEYGQLNDYYKSNNFNTIEEKIAGLRKDMGVMAIRGESGRPLDQLQALLEEAALLGYWRAT